MRLVPRPSLSIIYPPLNLPLFQPNLTSSAIPRKNQNSRNVSLLSLFQLLQQLPWRSLPISLRIILRPPPQILTRLLQRPRRLPPQLAIRTGRIARQVEDIAIAPRSNFIGQVTTHGVTEGFDNFKDGAAVAGAEVPGAYARTVGA